ncbi:MAG: FkbM family methyltransferase [Candidatus Pollutiaquabacter aromativorans]
MLTLDAYLGQPLEIEPELRAMFHREAPLVILDIGACEGEESIRYARMFPQARIVAFEPRTDNLEKLYANLNRYQVKQRVTVLPYALSDQEGKARFYLSSGQPEGHEASPEWDFGNKSSSLLPPSEQMGEHHAWLRFDNSIEVTTRRLDACCAELGLDRVDFMHVDVQGAEMMVLAPAADLLKRTVSVWMEVEAVELYKGQPLRNEVEAFMFRLGFKKVISTVGRVSGDQLYVRPELLSTGARLSLHLVRARRQSSTLLRKTAGRIVRAFR